MLPVACHKCQYEIAPVLGTRCPECGVVFDDRSVMVQHRRDEILKTRDRTLVLHASLMTLAILVAAIGAAVLTNGGWFALVVVTGALGVGLLGSAGVGVALVRFAPGPTRRLHAVLWCRTLWILHAPWLLIPALAALGVAVTLVVGLIDPDAAMGVVSIGSMVVFVLWLVLSVIALILWVGSITDQTRTLALHESPTLTTLRVLWGLVVWGGCLAVGFLGGIAAVSALMDIVGPLAF